MSVLVCVYVSACVQMRVRGCAWKHMRVGVCFGSWAKSRWALQHSWSLCSTFIIPPFLDRSSPPPPSPPPPPPPPPYTHIHASSFLAHVLAQEWRCDVYTAWPHVRMRLWLRGSVYAGISEVSMRLYLRPYGALLYCNSKNQDYQTRERVYVDYRYTAVASGSVAVCCGVLQCVAVSSTWCMSTRGRQDEKGKKKTYEPSRTLTYTLSKYTYTLPCQKTGAVKACHGAATNSRLLVSIGLFCKRAL